MFGTDGEGGARSGVRDGGRGRTGGTDLLVTLASWPLTKLREGGQVVPTPNSGTIGGKH